MKPWKVSLSVSDVPHIRWTLCGIPDSQRIIAFVVHERRPVQDRIVPSACSWVYYRVVIRIPVNSIGTVCKENLAPGGAIAPGISIVGHPIFALWRDIINVDVPDFEARWWNDVYCKRPAPASPICWVVQPYRIIQRVAARAAWIHCPHVENAVP